MLTAMSSTQPVSSPKIAVVLVTFNRAEMLKKNLASLRNQGSLTYFIIDNNSCDETQSVVETFSASTDDRVIYHNTGANLGGAGGFALGCQKALRCSEGFTHLWLTDDDVTFDTNCLKTLMPHLDQKTIWQPMRFTPEGQNAEASTTLIDLKTPWILNHKRNSIMNMEIAKASAPFKIESIPFEGPLIPRAVFDAVGLPDGRYFIFCDDLDLALRAQRAGFSIQCHPKAKMIRLNPSVLDVNPKDWKSYFVYRNLFRIQQQYGENFLVKNRPYLLAIIMMSYCIVRGNFKGIKILRHALLDAMSNKFSTNPSYIPSHHLSGMTNHDD